MSNPTIKKNLIYNTLYQVLSLLVPIVTAPYAARIFGADGIGVQSYVGSIVTYFSIFAQLGTQTYGQREIAMCRDDKEKASKTFWGIEIMSLITTFISLSLWGILTLFVGSYKVFFVIYSMSIINVAFDISWFFIGYEQFKVILIRNSIIKIVIMSVLFGLCRDKSDLSLYIALTCLATLLGAISLWPMLKNRLVKVSFKNLNLKKHFSNTIVYFIPTIATNIYTVLDKVMIGLITGDRFANGYYEQTTKITTIAITFVTAINGVMYPRMSNLFAEKKMSEIKDKLYKSLEFIMFLAVPIFLGLIVISNDFIPFFFGPGYDQVINLLKIYSVLILITAVSGCLANQYLVPVGRRKESSIVIVVGAAVNLLLNLFLIPILNTMGAVIASIVSETLILIAFFKMSDKFVGLADLWRVFWKRIIAGIIMCVAIILVKMIPMAFTDNDWANKGIRVVIQIALGAIVYFVSLYIMRDKGLKTYMNIITNKIKSIRR